MIVQSDTRSSTIKATLLGGQPESTHHQSVYLDQADCRGIKVAPWICPRWSAPMQIIAVITEAEESRDDPYSHREQTAGGP